MRRALLRWHVGHRRDLPWRRTHDPYRILVSEVMLQQTRVDHVVPFYARFLRRFPTIRSLARARPAEVLKLWYGLGYNRRAVNLQRAARQLVGKRFPADARVLETLPGLGRYSANAVATFAFNAPEPLLETNAGRVLHRVFVGPELPRVKRTRAQMYVLASAVLDAQAPRLWNEALFDLGATVCTKRAPRCVACPLQPHCSATPRILGLARAPRPQRAEPSFLGVPRRLWRGRVLRSLHGAPRTAPAVTRFLALSATAVPFIRTVLAALVSEGLAERQGVRYALPQARVVG